MELLEYQAKTLFAQVGIPVLPSQPIQDPRDLKRLHIPYPVVLKSQVRVGGRGQAGGIRYVENTIDAIAAARTILNLPILGEYPEVILAEAHYDAHKEFFLAIVQDYKRQCPVLLGSVQGGIQVKAVLAQIQKVEIEEFSPFYARRLARKMGLEGDLIQTVSGVIEKMYQLFSQNDLDLIEINPLGVNAEGEVMALDGKITVNDYGLGRHPEIIDLVGYDSPVEPNNTLTWVDPKATVGLVCNDLPLVWATWDLLSDQKLNLGAYGVVEDVLDEELLVPSVEQLTQILPQFSHHKVGIVFINLLSNPTAAVTLGNAIALYVQRQVEQSAASQGETAREQTSKTTDRNRRQNKKANPSPPLFPHFVVRIVGHSAVEAKQDETLPIYWTEDLDQAIKEIANLTKAQSSNKR